MSTALDFARLGAHDEPDTFRGDYQQALRLIERLHRLLLDVIKDEFDRSGGADLNSVLSMDEVLWKARRSQALIYWIRLEEGGSHRSSFATAPTTK